MNRAMKVGQMLLGQGVAAVIPHLMYAGMDDKLEPMIQAACLALVVKCDFVVVFGMGEESECLAGEIEFARRLGKTIIQISD
jgi:hypothetical protein